MYSKQKLKDLKYGKLNIIALDFFIYILCKKK